jgi:DNA-binding FrmR family transcriptional regulator
MKPTKPAHIDPQLKANNRKRLQRIEGQVRGVAKMIEEDRYCADVLIQIAAIQESLRRVGREVMRNHLQHCDTHANYDELLDLIYKHLR